MRLTMTYTALKKEPGLLLLHLMTICAGGYAENCSKVLHDEREETYIHVSWPSTCTSVNVEHIICVPCFGNCYQHSTDETKQHQTTWDVLTLRQISNSFCLCPASTNSNYCVHLSEETGYAGMYQPQCGDISVYSKIHHTYQTCVEALMSLIVFVILLSVSHKREILRTSNSQSCEESVISRALYCSNDVLPREIFIVGTVINLNYVTNFTFSCLDICKKTINWGSCNEVSYCTEFGDGKETSFKISRLYGITTHHISAQHISIYPLIATVKSYLSRVQDGTVPKDEEMCYEVRRFQSYNSVPVRASPMRLAQSGFYASGSGDETRCYSCRMTYREWRLMDQPDQIHRSMSPDCPHLNNTDQRNIPVSSSATESGVTTVHGVTGIYGVTGEHPESTGASETFQSGTPYSPTSSSEETTGALATETSPSALSGLNISRAVYPQYRDVSSRLDSYQGWGWSHVQDPQVLARAGFYYAGYRDCVRCFYCGVGLRTWEREDDPWVEHVRWRSSCDYVRLMRGEQFAIQALTKNASVPSSSLAPVETRTHNSQLTVAEDENDARTKAIEMGFQRDQVDRAVAYLTRSQSGAGKSDEVQLESLLEKLMSDDMVTLPMTTQSSSGSNQTSPSVSPVSGEEPVGVNRSSHMESRATIPGKMMSLMGSVADDSIPTSVTNQKADGHGLDWSNSQDCRYTNGMKKGEVREKDDEHNAASEVTKHLSASQERQLEEENQSLRDESTCKICLDNPICIVFLPCGHLVTCAECAPALRKCPICRALIRGTVRAHTVSSDSVNM